MQAAGMRAGRFPLSDAHHGGAGRRGGGTSHRIAARGDDSGADQSVREASLEGSRRT